MAAPLENYTREEQRSEIRFLWSEGVKLREIHRRMIQQYSGNYMNERKVYQWVERFQEGQTSVIDEHCSQVTHAQPSMMPTLLTWTYLLVKTVKQRKVQHHAGRETEARKLRSSSCTSVQRCTPLP
jgi:hypothetical protein